MKVYTSKVDWGLVALFVLVGVIALAAIFLRPPAESGDRVESILVLALAAGLLLWLFLTTRYIVTDTHLLVRAGPFRWRVLISEITAITPTTSPLSSPALSLDRLRVEYGTRKWIGTPKSILISPKDRDGFMADISERQAHLSQ